MKSKILLLIISLFLSFFSSNSIFSEEDNLNIPPKALPLSPIRISSYQTFKLENGLTVFLIEDHKLPTVSFVLYFDFLTKIKKTKYGLGELTTRLMKEGAGKRSKQQLDEELDFMGTDLVIQNNLIYASGLEKYSKESLEILSDIVKSPAFDKNEFQKIKEEIIAEIKSNKLDPNSEANNLMKTLLYPENHPYREIPSEESMQNIKIEDCKAYHNKFFKPGNSYLAIIGDISLDKAKTLVESSLGNWSSRKVKDVKIPALPKEELTKIFLLDREDSVQSVIKISKLIDLKPNDKNLFSVIVMNTILGGGTFRLYENLREKNGYTYGVYSSLQPDRIAGNFSIDLSTKNNVTHKSIEEIFSELERIQKTKVDEKELQLVKNYLTGQFSLSLENPLTLALFAIKTAIYHLPADFYDKYLENIRKVTAEDVQKAANHYIPQNKMKIVVVGKKKEILKDLNKLKDFKIVETNTTK